MRLFEGTPFDRPPRCEHCGELDEQCVCPPVEVPRVPPQQQRAKLSIEKRGKGKRVTVVRGLSADESDLPDLLSRLKFACSAGGTLKDEVLEIQGDQLAAVRRVLTEIGYRVSG